MGLFDGFFGSSESKSELPSWIEAPAAEMLQRSVDMGKTGYMPWTGPSVAALNPGQIGAMQNNSNMAAAFGMDSTMPTIRQPQEFANGIMGYSSMPLYNQNMEELQRTRPGQMDYYNSFFVDPTTGADGSRMQDNHFPTQLSNWEALNKQREHEWHQSPAEERADEQWSSEHISDVNERHGTTGTGNLGGVVDSAIDTVKGWF